MKFTKLSLIAVLAVSSAFAGGSTISGDARVFYGTDDIGEHDMFNKDGAIGDSAVNLNYAKKLSDTITINGGLTGISTLGLEGTLVGGTWVNHGGTRSSAGVDDKVWLDTANMVINPIDKTMVVAGRMKLKGAFDNPLAFTETWNIAENSFDGAAVVDTHLPQTTLVGVWVGRGNGHNGFENVDGGMSKYGALSLDESKATGAMNKGAYAAAAITKAIPNTTTQLWYYNVVGQANAYWLQADAEVSGATIGAQYASIMPKGQFDGKDDTNAFGLKVGYDIGGISLAGAYSQVDDNDGLVYMGNTATSGAFNGQSKLYTEAWWNFGFVGRAGAQSAMVSAGYKLGTTDLTAQYTTVANDKGTDNLDEMDEITLTATTKVGAVDATLALINATSDDDSIDGTSVQVYLTAPFSL